MSGRHWQRNQKKTIEDFENEPEEHIYKEGDYIYRDLISISLFIRIRIR
jgi:phosphodiesterase/alkaline phosphatase D-like protein